VLVESLSANLPIVTTNVGCVGEVIHDGTHALVVPVGDEVLFACAMERLCTDTTVYDHIVSQMQSVDLQSILGAGSTDYAEQWARTMVR
jgi:glycosyltransferase involved in cell wall biosynthesis